MKKIGLILIAAAVLFNLCACGLFGSENSSQPGNSLIGDSPNNIETRGENNMELTQRQQEILKQEGLPTNYSELNDGQKKAITAIEELFQYLDGKYAEKFIYVGYRAPSALDAEVLIVQPEGATSADNVTVTRIDGVCTDDYNTVNLRDAYESQMKAYFQAEFQTVDVFSEIEEVADQYNADDLRSAVRATSGIYVMETEAQDKDLKAIAEAFGHWYGEQSNGNSCAFSIYVVPESAFWSITRFNREEYSQSVIARADITVRADGTVIVR